MEDESDVGSEIERLEKNVYSNISSQKEDKEEKDLDETTLSASSYQDNAFNRVQHNGLNIGSLDDDDVPMKYCCRYLVSSFLLTGNPGELIPDKSFRVSVKSLALTCFGHILRLYPNVFFDTLVKPVKIDSEGDNGQLISDVLLYADHQDPQIRGNVSMIIGYLLHSIFIQHRGSFDRANTGSTITMDNFASLILKVNSCSIFFK